MQYNTLDPSVLARPVALSHCHTLSMGMHPAAQLTVSFLASYQGLHFSQGTPSVENGMS